jgi:galactokinase
MNARKFFGPGRPLFTATAPGRLDVMGGIADYSGSRVLEMPIREATTATVALRGDGRFRVYSAIAAGLGHDALVEIDLSGFRRGRSVDYSRLQDLLAEQGDASWAAYVIGCALVLQKEKQVPLRGADVYIRSDVPAGKGVSASAALEVSVMQALTDARKVRLGDTELPTLCQKVENQVVGAPCGLMDQLSCYLGRKNRLLPILCRPDIVLPPIDIPRGIRFVGIDSGVRHAVSGATYTDVRVSAFMGYSLIAARDGVPLKRLARTTGHAKSLPLNGYLANLSVSAFEQKYAAHLPEKMMGRAFTKKGGSTIDPVTDVRSGSTYAVAACTRHPIYENHRVELFENLLLALNSSTPDRHRRETLLGHLGELMYQAHAGYSACGLGIEVTDWIVEQARAGGASGGLYGAKITGGGSGGTVCLLCKGKEGVDSARKIAAKLKRRDGQEHPLFIGSSEGCRWR